VPSTRITAREVIGARRVVATRDALEKLQEALALTPREQASKPQGEMP
jgi:hypothetical protein